MANLQESRMRLERELLDGSKLIAVSSPDVTEQGFSQEDIFEPYRYNFGTTPSYGTMTTPLPTLGADPFEITVDAWTVNTEQYIVDHSNRINFVRFNNDNSLSLMANGAIRTWSAIPAFDGSQVTLRFLFQGVSDLSLEIRELIGEYYPHPDGPMTYPTDATFSFSSLSTAPAQLAYEFDGSSYADISNGSNPIQWGGASVNGTYLEFSTRNSKLSSSDYHVVIGRNNVGSQDNGTVIGIRDNGSSIAVRIGFRGNDNQAWWSFPNTDVNMLEFNRWRIERNSDGMDLYINDVIKSRSGVNTTSGADFRIDQLGRTEEFIAQNWIGEIYNLHVVSDRGTYICTADDNLSTMYISLNGALYDYFTLVNYTGLWNDTRPQFTGHIFEIFYDILHWSGGSKNDYQTNTFIEDGSYSGNDITLQDYSLNSWIDLGQGSIIYHTLDDNGLGAAFIMEDMSMTQRPALAAPFTQAENTNFGTNGGGVIQTFHYPSLPAPNQLLGVTNLSFNRRWDEYIPDQFHLNGIDQYIELDTVNGYSLDNGYHTFQADIWDYNPAIDTQCPIFATNHPFTDTFFGLKSRNGLGQVYMQNQGGYHGSGQQTIAANIPAGNWRVFMSMQNDGTSTPTHVTVWDLDQRGTDHVVNGHFTQNTDGWNPTNSDYVIELEGQRCKITNTSDTSLYPAIRSGSYITVEVGRSYTLRWTGQCNAINAYQHISVRDINGAAIAGTAGHHVTDPNETYTQEWTWVSDRTGLVGVQAQWSVPAIDFPVSRAIGYFDDIQFIDSGEYIDMDGQAIDGGQFTRLNSIGHYSGGDTGDAPAHYNGRISNVIVDDIINMPIDGYRTVGNERIYDPTINIENLGTGVNAQVTSYHETGWTTGEVFGGFYYETSVDSTGTGVVISLKTDVGDLTYTIPNYVAGEYNSLNFGYSPFTGIMTTTIDGVIIPALTTTEFRNTTLPVDAALRSTCGALAETGTIKHIKHFEVSSYETDGTRVVNSADLENSQIFSTTGLRDIEFIVERADNLAVGSEFSWETDIPCNVTIRRADDESFVLINLNGTPTVHSASIGGKIVCGNTESVDGYSAFFSSSYEGRV